MKVCTGRRKRTPAIVGKSLAWTRVWRDADVSGRSPLPVRTHKIINCFNLFIVYIYCATEYVRVLFVSSSQNHWLPTGCCAVDMCEAERCGLVACPALPLCPNQSTVDRTHSLHGCSNRSIVSCCIHVLSAVVHGHWPALHMHACTMQTSGIAVSGMWYPNLCQAPGDDGHANTRTLGVRVLLWFMPNAKSSVVIE